jgi:tRNA(Ile)-lysidine synthase
LKVMVDTGELEERVRSFAGSRTTALGAGRVVLAASGGADSTAMVGLLCSAGLIERRSAVVANFDHRLRGEGAAQRDLGAVEDLCRRFGLALETGAWDAPARGEAAARAARYGFLGEVAARASALVVVTGHTQDDQIETVMLNTLRGAGPYGLAGMAADAPWPLGGNGPRVLRPLLDVERAETRAYCDACGLRYVDDPTNDDLSFRRNRVRKELMAQLDEMPDARREVLAMAERTRRGVETLERATAHALLDDDGDAVRLSRAALRRMTPELAPYAYRQALRRLAGDAREFGRRHYALMARAADARTGSALRLPRGVVLTVDPDAVLLSVGQPRVAVIARDDEHGLPFSGRIGAWAIEVVEGDGDGTAVVAPPGSVVRGRRPGDRIQPRGMTGHKKLQDEYVDRKVPRRERDAAPVIACGGDVLWTPFGAAAEAASGRRYVVRARRVLT